MKTNRRYFLLGSATALAASAQPSNRVGTGMIGVGNRGSHLLLGVLQQENAKSWRCATSSRTVWIKLLPPRRKTIRTRIRTGER